MGNGSTGSFRFSEDRILSLQEQANGWQNKHIAAQEKIAELRRANAALDKKNQDLALQLASTNTLLAIRSAALNEYRRIFLTFTPADQVKP